MISPLPSIVTLAQAKKAARIYQMDEENDDLYLRLEIAHELVLDYVNNRVDDSDDAWLETVLSWDEDTAPRRVKGAILSMFVHLTRLRGDDVGKEAAVYADGNLPEQVRMFLYRLRDPTVA
jgi:hypothetical protein